MEGNHILYFSQVIPIPDFWYNELMTKVPWRTMQWNLPRLTCHDVQNTEPGAQLKLWTENFTENKYKILDIFGNFYRNGQDNYADTDGTNLHVISFSFGSTRRFKFYDLNTNKAIEPCYDLKAGDVLIFDPYINMVLVNNLLIIRELI